MYSIKFSCHKKSIAVALLLAPALKFSKINGAYGAIRATYKRSNVAKTSPHKNSKHPSNSLKTSATIGINSTLNWIDTTTTAPSATLNFMAQSIHTSSAAQTFTIRGMKLTEAVTVSTKPPFSLSKDSVIYQSTLTYDTTELASNQTVYVKFKPTTIGTYTENITNISAGADDKIVALIGTAIYSNKMMNGDRLDANNIITPNGDGRNDTWVINNIDQYPNNKVKVFDKSGNVIYQKQGYTNDWDGTYNNGPLTQGTYYYIVDFGEGLNLIFKGFITIVRG